MNDPALARIIHEQRPGVTRHFRRLIEQRPAQLHRGCRDISLEVSSPMRDVYTESILAARSNDVEGLGALRTCRNRGGVGVATAFMNNRGQVAL